MSRRDEVATGLAATEERIRAACEAAGRDRDELTVIVVTKTHPVSDVRILADLGVTDVGENRHPEAERKAAETGRRLRWHFLGGLQTNKAAAVARYADLVHSVDRVKLVHALSRGAVAAERTLSCLVQVDFASAGSTRGASSNPGRSGVVPSGVAALAEAIAGADRLELAGVMTVAPLGEDPAPHFAHLVRLSEQLRQDHPAAAIVSAGMSGDFAEAIAAGATHLRIGRAILGERASSG